jgi:ribosomal protein S18 acetylase RimI-like enzyme
MNRLLHKLFFVLNLVLFSLTVAVSAPTKENKTPQQQHEWAVHSHREFWTLVGQMAGYESRNEIGYQYVKSPNIGGLNYVYIAKDYKNADAVINLMKGRAFTIFFEADDDDHMFKYITSLKESDNFITMGMDLQKIDNNASFKPGVKVWKVTTDAEFEQWLNVTASRRNPQEAPLLRKYFESFKPSKNNQKISFYLGSFNGKVAGSSLMYFSQDFTSLYWVGVHPDHRRHGLGSALSYFPLKDAVAKGYRWSVLQAQPLGVPVYPKLGFRKVGLMKVFYYLPARY